MPLSFNGSDTLVGQYFNTETGEFQDTPIEIEIPTLPEKLTQEELRFMRIIADARIQWTIHRGQGSIQHISGVSSEKMKEQYAKITLASTVASMFIPKKRVEELTEYAKKHPRVVIYLCETRRIR